MKFQKLGTLKPFGGIDRKLSSAYFVGSQAPTVVVMKDRIRVYFSARDPQNQSNCFFYDLNRDNPLEIIDTCQEPLIPLGRLGEADENGCMISAVSGDTLYYAGWNNTGRDDVRYRTACMTYNLKTGRKEVLLDRDTQSPCGTSMPFPTSYNRLLFMSYKYWTEEGEPVYYIHCKDRLLVAPKEISARPVVMFRNNFPYLFYCSRAASDYRTNRDNSYKMKCLRINSFWSELMDTTEIPLEIEGCQEDLMVAYGYPFQVDKKVYMLHNSDFTSPLVLSELVD